MGWAYLMGCVTHYARTLPITPDVPSVLLMKQLALRQQAFGKRHEWRQKTTRRLNRKKRAVRISWR